MNDRQFEEVQVIGKKKIVKEIFAGQYPEKMFIRDLVLNYSSMAEEISEAEYESARILET